MPHGRSLAEQVSETGTSPSICAKGQVPLGAPSEGDFFGGRGTFSVRWNAEGDNPPVDVKHGDGRFNYYPTNLYSLHEELDTHHKA